MMKQEERLDKLIRLFMDEFKVYEKIDIPEVYTLKRKLLRALMNVRPPKKASLELIHLQDAFLKQELLDRGIVNVSDISTIQEEYGVNHSLGNRIYLWQGDITRLAVDCIVNAANSQMLGCFVPNHSCIDNAIHSAAGIQLRNECFKLMEIQGHDEKTGKAKITNAYNLPCKFVIHTVGPIIQGLLTMKDKLSLEACYQSCLELATKHGLKNIAFCCISTGEFHFPCDEAAKIAIRTVKKYLAKYQNISVVFNVFKEEDLNIYIKRLKELG